MSAEVLLNALDDLYGQAPVSPASAGSQARTLTNPALPASWQSPAAVGLDNRQRDLDNARGSFAAADDNTKNQLDQANTAVKDGKKQLGDIKDNYRLNKARLSGMDSPELAAKRDELDRVRSQDGVNTVRGTQARLPNMAGAGMNPLMSAMPAAMAPAAALPQMLNTPMQAFSPLTSALQGLTIPQQVTHALPTNGPTDAATVGGVSRMGIPKIDGLDLDKPGLAPEDKLQHYTKLINRAVTQAFPEIKDIGGWRPDSLKWHPQGLAVDVMLPNHNSAAGQALGQRILGFLQRYHSELGVAHVIYRQRQFNPDGTSSGMPDRGGDTANHFDHLHVASIGGGYD